MENYKDILNKCHFHVFWSDEDDCFIGICQEFPSLSAHGYTDKEAESEIKFVVTECMKWMEEEGEELPQFIT